MEKKPVQLTFIIVKAVARKVPPKKHAADCTFKRTPLESQVTILKRTHSYYTSFNHSNDKTSMRMPKQIQTDTRVCVRVCIKIFIWSADLCHELVGDGLQELRLVLLGADKVGWTRGSGLREGEKEKKKQGKTVRKRKRSAINPSPTATNILANQNLVKVQKNQAV